jgi:hypothetical protein
MTLSYMVSGGWVVRKLNAEKNKKFKLCKLNIIFPISLADLT